MPFIAECPFCTGKVRVPDRSVGRSVPCPRCGDHFTLVPMPDPPDLPVSEPRTVSVTRPTPPPETPLGVRVSQPADEPAGDSSSSVAEAIAEAPVPATPAPSDFSLFITPARKPRQPLTIGHISFLFASIAAVSYSVCPNGSVPLAVSSLGLVLGFSSLMTLRPESTGVVYTYVGAAVCSVLVILSGWVVLTSELVGKKPLLHLGGHRPMVFLPEGEKLPTTPSEWINARRGAIAIDDVTIRIAGARIGQVDFKEPRKQKSVPQKPALLLTVRVSNIGIEHLIDYQSWNEPRDRDKPGPRLHDNRGQSYAQRLFGGEDEILGQLRRAGVPPTKRIDDLLVFDAPPPTIDYLRLELPGWALGATGTLRLEIPKDMIQREGK